MYKELFLRTVLEAAERIVARALENGLADIYDLQLVGTSSRCASEGDDALEVVTHGETLLCDTHGWFVDAHYRRTEGS